jgi:hypothetical protein
MWTKVAATTIAILVACYIVSLFWTPADMGELLRKAHHLYLGYKIVFTVGKFALFAGVGLITGGVWLWQKRRQIAA